MPLSSALPVVDRPIDAVATRRGPQSPETVPTAEGVVPEAGDGGCVLPASAVDCTVLTPSGTVVATGRVAPRAQEHLAEAYVVQLTEIEPRGVLEAMVYSDQPTILLRYEGTAEARVRIDHITGPPPSRAFYCQPA